MVYDANDIIISWYASIAYNGWYGCLTSLNYDLLTTDNKQGINKASQTKIAVGIQNKIY